MIRVLIVTLVLLFVTDDDRTAVPGFFDLPVTGGTATFEMLGLRPEERGHAIALLSRQMFSQSAGTIERNVGVRNFVAQLSAPGKEKETSLTARSGPPRVLNSVTSPRTSSSGPSATVATYFSLRVSVVMRAAPVSCMVGYLRGS